MPRGATGGMVAVCRRTSRVLFTPETFDFTEVTRMTKVTRRMPSHVEYVSAGSSPHNIGYIRVAGLEFRLLTLHLSEEEGGLTLDFDQDCNLRHPFTEKMLAQWVTSERVLLRSLCPDTVVIGVAPSQFISARVEYVPLVSVRLFAYSLMHLEVVHAAGATGLLPRTPPGECLVDNMATHALHMLGTRLPLSRSFHSAAKANGILPPQGMLNGLIADLNFIVTVPYLFPGWLKMPQEHRMVGPAYARLPGELPEFLVDLAAGPQPLVYFTMSSLGNRDLILRVPTGLGQADCWILAPVCSHLRREDLGSLPRNAYATDRLSAHQLGDAVGLTVTHNGEGTVQISYIQGWPLIGTPLQFEQRFNTQRCAALGSARLMSQRETHRTNQAELVCQALVDDGMHSRARRMTELMEGLDGPGRAAEVIRELL